MNTLHSGIVFLIAAVIFHLLGRGITTVTGGNAAAAPLALLALCISCVAGALGLYRLIAGVLAQRMRPSLPFTLDRPLPGLLRYQRGERAMLIPLALDGRVPRL